jgi:hypothetical protein
VTEASLGSITGTITNNNTTQTSLTVSKSRLTAANVIATSAAGVGSVQIFLSDATLITTGNVDVSRTVLGTTGSNVISASWSNLLIEGTLTMANSGGPFLLIGGSRADIATLSSTTAAGIAHIRVEGGSQIQVRNSGTITGGGTTSTGMIVENGATAFLNNVTFSAPSNAGPGILCTNSRLGLSGCTFNNCITSGVELTRSMAAFSAVTGTGNGGFGVNLIALSQLSVTGGTTVTGTLGNLNLGARGAKTWANVATGEGQHTSDYNGNTNQNRNCQINQI